MSELEHHVEHPSSNKKVALLIAILALFLALSETIGKSYQTEVLTKQMEASDLWSFYQAKSIRQSSAKNVNLLIELLGKAKDPQTEEALSKLSKDIAHYDSDPVKQDGKQELMLKAKAAEVERDVYLQKYHLLEIAAGLLQVAIVLASASVITGIAALYWLSGLLGIGSLFFLGYGVFITL